MKRARLWTLIAAGSSALMWSGGAAAQPPAASRTITEADCTAAKLGDGIPGSAIGELVSGITLSAPRWNAAASSLLKNGVFQWNSKSTLSRIDDRCILKSF